MGKVEKGVFWVWLIGMAVFSLVLDLWTTYLLLSQGGAEMDGRSARVLMDYFGKDSPMFYLTAGVIKFAVLFSIGYLLVRVLNGPWLADVGSRVLIFLKVTCYCFAYLLLAVSVLAVLNNFAQLVA